MSLAEVIAACRGADFVVRDGRIELETFGGRKHTVHVHEPAEGLVRFSSMVARATAARRAGISHIECWERNRLSELVAFRVGTKGEVIGETWIPVASIAPELIRIHVEHLAVASDRFEHQISGEDEF